MAAEAASRSPEVVAPSKSAEILRSFWRSSCSVVIEIVSSFRRESHDACKIKESLLFHTPTAPSPNLEIEDRPRFSKQTRRPGAPVKSAFNLERGSTSDQVANLSQLRGYQPYMQNRWLPRAVAFRLLRTLGAAIGALQDDDPSFLTGLFEHHRKHNLFCISFRKLHGCRSWPTSQNQSQNCRIA
jgi:hypothetical protein